MLCALAAELGLNLDYPGIGFIQRELAAKVPALAALASAPPAEREPQPVLTGPAHP